MLSKEDLEISGCLDNIRGKGVNKVIKLLIHCLDKDIYINTSSAREVLKSNQVGNIIHKAENIMKFIDSIGNKRKYRDRSINKLGLVNICNSYYQYRYRCGEEFIKMITNMKKDRRRYSTLLETKEDIFPIYFLNLIEYESKKKTLSNENYIFWCLCNYLMERYKNKHKEFYESILDPLIFIDANKKGFKEFILQEITNITSKEFRSIYKSDETGNSYNEGNNENPLTIALTNIFNDEITPVEKSQIDNGILDITLESIIDKIKNIEVGSRNIKLTININIINKSLVEDNKKIQDVKEVNYKPFRDASEDKEEIDLIDKDTFDDVNIIF